MSEELRAWLSKELERRRWSQGELARQAGISRSFVSMVLSGDTSPSINFCHKVAQALGEAPEKVLRLAGILPSATTSDNDPILTELQDLVRNLPPQQREEALRYLQYLYQGGKDKKI
jgi:transcriptional regulator with XRE-family HTH domain